MGFQAPHKVYKLTFEDPEYEGLEVRVKSSEFGTFLDIAQLMDLDTDADVTAKDVEDINALFGYFVDAIIDWNLEDDGGVPVPQTVKGLRTLDLGFVMDMVQAWVRALKGTSPGLSRPSGSGEPSLEASIPMEALLPSRAS